MQHFSYSEAEIYYTIGGAEPTTNDLLYTTALVLNDASDKDNIFQKFHFRAMAKTSRKGL